MNDDFDQEGTVFRDLITLALLGFVTIVVILLPHINPPTKSDDIAAPGNVYVQITWPPSYDTDVDLWVQAPTDRPVGYSAKDGHVFNLLRDDLGRRLVSDATNFEVAFSRGAPAGEYVVNLHLYSDRSGKLPVTVQVEVSVRQSKGKVLPIWKAAIPMAFVGQETTVIRFRLDEKGRVIPGSKNRLPIKIRGAKDSAP